MRPVTLSSRLSVIAPVVLLLCSAPLPAQSIRGTLRDHLSHAPISDALVQLLADRERVVASGTSSARGEYLLRAPADGMYRLRVLRIGFRPWFSEPVTLKGTEIVLRDFDIQGGIVVLAELKVTAKSSCKRSPADDSTMEAVWQQARTTLGLIEASDTTDVEFLVRTWYRTLDPYERQRQETWRSGWGRGAWPVHSLPPDSLAEFGFIQATDSLAGPVYYGPDVAVFFSEAFLGTHCFRLLPAPKGETDLIGIGFEPLEGRKVYDIEGALWVHKRAGLSRLEYWYSPMPGWVPKRKAGGVVRFDRLESGRPIITEWSLMAPIPQVEQYRVILHGWRVTLGEVNEIRVGGVTTWKRVPS